MMRGAKELKEKFALNPELRELLVFEVLLDIRELLQSLKENSE